MEVGPIYHSVLLKCNYDGPFSDVLLAIKVDSMVSLTLETYMHDSSLDGFERLPFKLQELVIQQRVMGLPAGGIPAGGGFSELKKVTIASTRVSSVPQGFFYSVRDSLKSLSIYHNNDLTSLDPKVLQNLTKLEDLRLTENRELQSLTGEHFSTLPNLKTIHFNDDNSKRLAPDLFLSNTRLTEIEITSEECRVRPVDCYRTFNSTYFSHLSELSSFTYCAGEDVHATFQPDAFAFNLNLQTLDIKYSTLAPNNDLKIAEPLSKLRSLTLLGCDVQSLEPEQLLVDKPDLEMVDFGEYGRDSYNYYFYCKKCLAVDTLVLLQKNGMLKHPVMVDCDESEMTPEEAKKEFCPNGFSPAFIAIITMSVLVIVSCVVVSFAVSWREKRRRLEEEAKIANLEGCEYDVFLSYAAEDGDCAAEILRILETENSHRCLEHSRDFEPGESIVANISRAVATSKMTVLVLSQHYLQSDWCDSEINQADSAGRKILVVKRTEDEGGKIERAELERHDSIARHVDSHTYLEEDDSDFARKLEAAVAAVVRTSDDDDEATDDDEDDDGKHDSCFKLRRSCKLGKWRDQVELAQRDPEANITSAGT